MLPDGGVLALMKLKPIMYVISFVQAMEREGVRMFM